MKKFTCPLILLALIGTTSQAEEVFRVVDEEGNVTFTDSNIDTSGDVETIELPDSPANTLESNTPYQQDMNDYMAEQEAKRKEEEEKRKEQAQTKEKARKAVEAAEAALEAAKVVKAGDFYKLPEGGIRYNQTYFDRVKAAEEILQDARAYYDTLK